MGGAGRGANTLDKESWLYCEMKRKKVHSVDIQQLLGISRPMLYQVLRNPSKYLTGDDMMKLALRLDVPLIKVFNYCVGGAAQMRATGKTWFESDDQNTEQ